MSMRPPVDRQRSFAFLQQLGQQFRKPGRVYLVGGPRLSSKTFARKPSILILRSRLAIEITASSSRRAQPEG